MVLAYLCLSLDIENKGYRHYHYTVISWLRVSSSVSMYFCVCNVKMADNGSKPLYTVTGRVLSSSSALIVEEILV